MFLYAFGITFFCLSVNKVVTIEEAPKPHIVTIIADDLGFNDVGFHGAKIFPTPNIDSLAYHGVIMNQFYSSSLCTPSRSALMTGKFPIFTGMQHSVIVDAEPWGLPLELKTLPQYLKQGGYSTHLVGKWHLGFFSRNYTPNYRGFDSFFGYFQGHQDYFSHRAKESSGTFDGYDLHKDHSIYVEPNEIYGTDLYTAKAVDVISKHDPSKPLYLQMAQLATHGEENPYRLQAPACDIDRFKYISDPLKRIYAAMVYKLDECVGRIVQALRQKNMLQNSIIVFMSDNNAPTIGLYATTGSNYPFRGIKAQELEGGTHLPMAIWSPLIKQKQRVSNILMHMVDLLPTLCAAAGIDVSDANIDGINMWDVLRTGSEISLRTEFPYNIDPAGPKNSSGAIRVGNWKYYKGNNDQNDEKGWLGTKYGTAYYPGISDNYELVLESATNIAIASMYNETEQYNRGSNQTPLTKEKIKYLQKTAGFRCPNMTGLPLCDITAECLFNLKDDPCERYDMAKQYPKNFKYMKNRYEEYRKKVVAPRNKPRDERANPAFYGGAWVSWYDYLDLKAENLSSQGSSKNYTSLLLKLLPAFIVIFISLLMCLLAIRCVKNRRMWSAYQKMT